MNAETAPYLPFNGNMLRWAREWRGRSIDETAVKLKVSPQQIMAWENDPDVKPTVRQARALANFYGRAFMEFFYDEAPEIVEPTLIPDYRLHRGAVDPSQNREILEIQRWAEMQRINALELYADVGETPFRFPDDLVATLNDDVEAVAVSARVALDFSFAAQKNLSYEDRQNLPEFLRNRMERIGVLVMRENKLTNFGVSGLCIVQFPLPIIVFASEVPARSAFTLMHEFAHIIIRESAISGGDKSSGGTGHDRRVERWCDKFAAAFLVPKAELEALRPKPARPAPEIDDVVLATLAKAFRVSQHAMIIRLVDLHYVHRDYYWNVKRPQFLADEAKWNNKGIPKVWVSRIWNKVGNLYTGLVLEALGTGKIQSHQAQSFFGIKNPSHLTAIRQEFGGS